MRREEDGLTKKRRIVMAAGLGGAQIGGERVANSPL